MTQAQQPADLPAGPPDPALLQALLRRHGLLNAGETIQIRSLGGGVSNNVLRVDTPRQAIVIKQSLPKLRVEMDWFADQARIWRERDYLLLLGAWMPANAPRVLFSDPAHFILAMTAVGDATLWKTTLMAGRCDPQTAARAGQLLAQIHTASHRQPALADQFQRAAGSPDDSFEQLRIDPYWRTVARRHPDLAAAIATIIARMEANPLALVHGDYSPKNIFVKKRDGDLVILDAEVAHWGDPTFDVAFCLNHFLLKAVYHNPNIEPFLQGAQIFWQRYQTEAPPALAQPVAERLPGQLAALFLARVDGKSPVEYLVDDVARQAIVRDVARALLLRYPAVTFEQIMHKLAARCRRNLA